MWQAVAPFPQSTELWGAGDLAWGTDTVMEFNHIEQTWADLSYGKAYLCELELKGARGTGIFPWPVAQPGANLHFTSQVSYLERFVTASHNLKGKAKFGALFVIHSCSIY